MNYSDKRKYSGSTQAAFQSIEATLIPNGFRIEQSSPTRLELKGRGMQSSKENPVRGATEIRVEARGGFLKLDASLGGVKKLALFVCLFPLILWGGFAVAGFLKSAEGGGLNTNALVGAGVWFVLGPAMAFWFRKRTIGALEDMLENAVVSAGRG